MIDLAKFNAYSATDSEPSTEIRMSGKTSPTLHTKQYSTTAKQQRDQQPRQQLLKQLVRRLRKKPNPKNATKKSPGKAPERNIRSFSSLRQTKRSSGSPFSTMTSRPLTSERTSTPHFW